jgi:photosystem II stability/assembly factor-like uncharacterized protein
LEKIKLSLQKFKQLYMKRLFTVLALAISIATLAQNFNWTAQTSGITTNLRDVYFTDNQTGWAVGNSGVILHTADGGQTWAAQTSGTTLNLFTVYFIDNQTGWAAGHDLSSVLLKTTNGGTTWTEIPTTGINQIRDIAFANANNGWMVTGSPSEIYETTDGGTNWTLQTDDPQFGNDFGTLTVATDSTAYVGGYSQRSVGTNSYADVYTQPYNPITAYDFSGSTVSNFKTTDSDIRCVDFPASNIGFAGGSEGTVYKLEVSPGGSTRDPWQVNIDLGTSNFIWDLSFPTVAQGMFLAGAPNNMGMLVYHTSDTGNTWNMMPDSLPTIFDPALHAPDANTAWIVGSQGIIYKGEIDGIGLEETALLAQVRLFPNPTAGKVTVEVNGAESAELNYRVVDITGRELLNGNWQMSENAERFELDLSNVVTGIYLLQITDGNGHTSVSRVVKR